MAKTSKTSKDTKKSTKKKAVELSEETRAALAEGDKIRESLQPKKESKESK